MRRMILLATILLAACAGEPPEEETEAPSVSAVLYRCQRQTCSTMLRCTGWSTGECNAWCAEIVDGLHDRSEACRWVTHQWLGCYAFEGPCGEYPDRAEECDALYWDEIEGEC